MIEANAAGAPLVTRLATALAGKIAADFGATVVRIEPAGGDPLRLMPPFLGQGPQLEGGALFQFLTSSKRLAAIDVTQQQGERVFARLADQFDAILTDDPSLTALSNRPPVRVIVQPFAASDTFNDPIEEIDILALGGLLEIIGDPAREPLKLGGHQCAYTAGLAAFTGLVAGLACWARDGRGEVVDISVLDVAYWTNWKTFAERHYKGSAPTRQGEMAEWQVVPCRDGHAAVVYLEKDWPNLCRMVGDPALQVQSLATQEARRAQGAMVLRHLREWFSHRTRAEVYTTAKEFGLPVAPVVHIGELQQDEQYLAQKFFATIHHSHLGALTIPTVPVAWNGKRFNPHPYETLHD